MRGAEVGRPAVYILASRRHGTLYIGVTANLSRRIHEHRTGMIAGFTLHYDVKRLVHAEMFESMADAIAREKRLKKWRRMWKIVLNRGAESLLGRSLGNDARLRSARGSHPWFPACAGMTDGDRL